MFIDFSKAFDNLNRQMILKDVDAIEIRYKYIRVQINKTEGLTDAFLAEKSDGVINIYCDSTMLYLSLIHI